MTYVVKPILDAKRQWALFVSHPDSLLMDRLSVYETRKAAITAARLLAGWRGTVLVEK